MSAKGRWVALIAAGVLAAACTSGTATPSPAATPTAAPASAAAAPASAAAASASAAAASASAGAGACPYTIGIVAGHQTNPYFAKLEEATKAQAAKLGLCVITAESKEAGDAATQITAIQDMINRGVKGISIYPATSAVAPYVKQAMDKGILVVGVDTVVDGVAATIATDNFAAGKLDGEWAKAQLAGATAHIGFVDYDLTNTTALDRHNGFLAGFGITDKSPEVAGMLFTKGDAPTGQSVMENLLTAHPDINVVYTVNEPAAQGAAVAIANAKLDHPIYMTSIDGSCTGAQAVKDGKIGATVQQLPAKMGEMSVDMIDQYVTTGQKPSGTIDSGETLITDKPAAGVPSQDGAYGLQNCWGG